MKFFDGSKSMPDELLDTKFFVRKLKNEVFTCDSVISFERIISKDVDLNETFEGHMSEKFNLIKTMDLESELARSSEVKGILLVHDKLSLKEEAKVKSKYTESQTCLVGALWFYLSIYFNVQLPIHHFEPS